METRRSSAVLVTGGTGFIGRRLTEHLAETGAHVRCLVRPHHPEDVFGDPRIEVAFGELADAESVRSAVAGVDTVFHLAAVVGDWGEPERFRAVNVDGTRTLFEAALEDGARVVLASSITVYGDALETSVCDEETAHGTAFGSYGETKQEQERLASAYAAQGLDVLSLRLGNVYGPGSDVWVDTTAEYLTSGLPSLIGDGQGDACLLHVDNAVAALAAAQRVESPTAAVYNVADGHGVTWARYFTDLALLADAPAPRSMPRSVAGALAVTMESVWRALRRTSRPPLTREALAIASSRAPLPIDRAREELGYDPPVSYEDGMRTVAEYLRGEPS